MLILALLSVVISTSHGESFAEPVNHCTPFSKNQFSHVTSYKCLKLNTLWAATWQNQQNECAPSEDSDQPGCPPSLIRVLAFRMKKPRVLSYPLSTQRRLWSDWTDAQADLCLRWAHSQFVGFVMSRLLYACKYMYMKGKSAKKKRHKRKTQGFLPGINGPHQQQQRSHPCTWHGESSGSDQTTASASPHAPYKLLASWNPPLKRKVIIIPEFLEKLSLYR